jgi:hypothetical protein
MRVRVAKRHLKRGIPNSSRYCPVALAIAECLGRRVDVSQRRVLLGGGSVLRLPSEVMVRIWYFDQRGVMDEFEFEL